MDLWHVQLPTPLALAFVAAMGYLIARCAARRRPRWSTVRGGT